MMDRPLAPAGSCSVAAVIGGARRAPITAAIFAMLVTGCGTQPVARTDGHIKSEATPLTGQTPGAAVESSSIPEPVRHVPLPPPPVPRVDKVKYSIMVKEVPVQDLLFAISRDIKDVNIDVHPGLEGKVTLNAIDQTLEQILTRISQQSLIRWDIEGPNIVVRPDTPFLKLYVVDYINMSRESSGTIGVQTQVVGVGGGSAAGGAAGQNSAQLRLDNKVKNDFWTTLEKNLRDILLEEDKVIDRLRRTLTDRRNSAQSSQNNVQTTGTGAAAGAAGSGGPAGASAVAGSGNQSVQGGAASAQNTDGQSVLSLQEIKEANPVIVNRETGTISVRANSRVQEKIAQFINHLVGSARRQVMIEATVVEVVLNDNYQSGVDWSALGLQGLGYSIKQNFTGANLTESPFFSIQYRNPNAASGGDISSTLKLLSTYGNTRVLSSPKIMTLNNQTAVMRVVENSVYFTVQSTVTQSQVLGGAPTVSYNTTLNVVPEGFVMNVTPQISSDDIINLNIRPSVSRITSYVNDPNPDLGRAGVVSKIPVIQTREFETMMRVSSGQTAVLGGLMQDSFQTNRDGLPLLSRVPVLGDAVSYRNDTGRKSELVVFIRAMVIREASLDSDLSEFRRYLPGTQFFKDSSPSVDLMNPKSYQPVPVVPEGEPRKAP